ncbi:hypothetical protein ATCC90586_011584 [Pythium insidiosum]|nr:hypothetical protein ATCC90586_011584 [Pythium insidiosum]
MSSSEQPSDQATPASSDEMSAEPRQPAPGSPTPDPASSPSSRALVPFCESAPRRVTALPNARADLCSSASRPWQFFSATAPPATISWRDVVARVGRGLTRHLDAAGEADDALRRDLAAARGVLDQRLLYLFNATAASAACSPAAASRGDDDWAVPAADVLSAVLGDDGETLFGGEPQPAPPVADVLAEVAEAARLASALRGRYGAHRLVERISSTALACSWLTHVVQSLFELVRLQDLERFTDQGSPPLATLEVYSRAQIAASQRHSAQRDDALRESLARCRSLEHQLAAARAGEVEITRQHEMLADLFDRRGASLDAARQRLVEADRQRDRLEARVSELEGQLADLRRLFDKSTPGLSSRQARHVFAFLWQHGYGQDEEGDYEMGDDGDFADDDLGDDDLCVAIPATQASALLPPAAPPRPAPLVIDVDADDAADVAPAHADRADHADAADSEAHSARGVKRPAALARSQGDNVGGGDAGGAAPSAPGGAPLTFTGSDAASHVASYTAVPAAPPGVALAPPVFPRVPLPFALGNVRGRSSVLQYNSLDETQRPWDAMWRGRVRHVFLFNPNQLRAAQVDWMNQVLRFMYRYRRQYWQRQHWFPLSRQSGAPPSITAAYATREASDRELVVAFRALTDSAPPGTSTALFWASSASS